MALVDHEESSLSQSGLKLKIISHSAAQSDSLAIKKIPF